MGAGALTICHNKTAVLVKEDMKKMVQIPVLWPTEMSTKHTKLFGVSLLELRERGLVQDGVPVAVRRMVEHLRKYGLQQEGLFRVSGSVRAVETLKQRLDSGEDVDFFSEVDTSTVASLLKLFLRDLPEGLVASTVQQALIQNYQECGDDGCSSDLRDLLQELPDVHYSCLCYLCHFLTLVERHHKDNRMTALNLATVFGPSVFHVAPGFEAIKEQNICNKIMAKLIQNYNNIFETNRETDRGGGTEERTAFILVKETHVTDTDTKPSPGHLDARTATLVPRQKVELKNTAEDAASTNKSWRKTPKAKSRKKKVTKGKSDSMLHVVPQPARSSGTPRAKSLSIPIVVPLTSKLRSASPEGKEMTPVDPTHQDATANTSLLGRCDVSPCDSTETLSSSQEEDRPISPFYMSNHLSPVHCRPNVVNFLDSTIRSTVQQHLFEANPVGHQVDFEMSPRTASPRVTPTARQRRRQKRQQEQLQQDKSGGASVSAGTDKENLPSSRGSSPRAADSHVSDGGYAQRRPRPRKFKHNPTLVKLGEYQDVHALRECVGVLGTYERPGAKYMEAFGNDNSQRERNSSPRQTFRMKIQESPVTCDTGRAGGGGEVQGSDPDCERTICEEVRRLDLTGLTGNNWGEPVTACPSLQRESMDREEARMSPHAGGHMIRQLLEEDSDPMLSPRFYAYGHGQQFLDDTEVPPSPPNAHSFVSRRRSLSLGSYDDDKEELTIAQITKRIHVLKKKIHKFEERFEDERKYRPSHSDKVANPEVLRWVNELAKLRRDLKEQKLLKSEEDLPPVTRQRSNTLPKSFGSQLEKKPQQEKAAKPPVESTLEVILKKLQEKREEVGRPEDIKDMTREQIGGEKLALQKSLLYYESIHGRPVTKNERQIMKPLYDRYRLIKQILCRATTIPVIGSPSSKRRGPALQPIIEGEPALFFDEIKEEEDGSEDEGDSKTQLTVTFRPEISMLSFLDHMNEEVDGFISPVDDLSPAKNTTDMRLSNLHSATIEELVEQLQETREEKKRLRKSLREFEDEFFRQNGRNAQKEDRSPLADEYSEYKHVKAKLRLLEVLISKRDSTKFI